MRNLSIILLLCSPAVAIAHTGGSGAVVDDFTHALTHALTYMAAYSLPVLSIAMLVALCMFRNRFLRH